MILKHGLRGLLAGIVATTALLPAGGASAHPHVLVDARAEVAFSEDGRITAIRHIWQFDPAFTAYAIQGLDADGDNQLSDAELAPLAQVNVESLAEFGFFTRLTVDGKGVTFAAPAEYWLEFHGGRLTLFYSLPLKTQVAPGREDVLEVYDPEYFVAFSFMGDPVRLVGAPAGCGTRFIPPKELNSAMAMMLSQIPADQRELPSELSAVTGALSNRIVVACGN